MPIARRSFILGLGSLLAAPAIVRADSLMRIVPWKEDIVAYTGVFQFSDDDGRSWHDFGNQLPADLSFSELNSYPLWRWMLRCSGQFTSGRINYRVG